MSRTPLKAAVGGEGDANLRYRPMTMTKEKKRSEARRTGKASAARSQSPSPSADAAVDVRTGSAPPWWTAVPPMRWRRREWRSSSFLLLL